MKKYMAIAAILFGSLGATAQTLNDLVLDAAKDGIAIIRQDYQFVDDDENEVRNKDNKEYWGRVYSVAARVGDEKYLLTSDGVRPWLRESYSKHDRFQPKVSASAYRNLDMPEFESFDFEEEEISEIRHVRLFTASSPDGGGFAMEGTTGSTPCYVVWVYTKESMNEYNETQPIFLSMAPFSVNFDDAEPLYNVPEAPENALGGIVLRAVYGKPGKVTFTLCGNCQLVGGRWRTVGVDSSVSEIPAN